MRPLPRAAACGVLLALLGLSCFASRHDWSPVAGLRSVTPRAVSGDEPHYLLVANLILAGHLTSGDAYDRVLAGKSDQMGQNARGHLYDHHTIVVDPKSGRRALWADAYDRTRSVQCGPGCVRYRRKVGYEWIGPGAVELPAHPIAFPLLLAAGLWPFAGDPSGIELRAIDLVLFLSWLGVVATWLAARRAGLSPGEALAAAALLGAASPWLPYSRSLFSETSAGLFLALAAWALASRQALLCGLAVVAAAAIKPALGVVALGLFCALLLERRRRDALVLAAVSALGGAALVACNLWLAGVPVIGGAKGYVVAQGGSGVGSSVADALVSQTHGLLLFAPWTALALIGMVLAFRRQPQPGAPVALVRALALGSASYLAVLLSSAFASGGFAYGPRQLVPLLPWLALAAVGTVAGRGRAWRGALLVLGLAGAAIAVPSALRYASLFNQPVVAAWKN